MINLALKSFETNFPNPFNMIIGSFSVSFRKRMEITLRFIILSKDHFSIVNTNVNIKDKVEINKKKFTNFTLRVLHVEIEMAFVLLD